MEQLISSLLKRYESGALSRRELIGGVAALVVAGGAMPARAQVSGFVGATINHVSILCSDVQRSSEWYQRVFGLPVRTATTATNVRLGVGPSHLTLRPVEPYGIVDHFCIGVDNFDRDSVVRDLRARGVEPELEGGAQGLNVKDPDGYPVQLQDSSSF